MARRRTARKPETIDDFLAVVDDDKRAALNTLRNTIKAAAPGVEECISYGVPAFRLRGSARAELGEGPHC